MTGEAKNEDLNISGAEEMLTEDDLSDVGETEEVISESVVPEQIWEEEDNSDETIDDGFGDVYFFENGFGEDGGKYRETIKEYFDTFYDYYSEAMQDDEEAMEIIEEYRQAFEFLLAHYESGGLDENAMLELYGSEGEGAVEEYVDKIADYYEELDAMNDVNIQEFVLFDGRSKLKLISNYQSFGCLSSGELDYDCLELNVEKYDELLKESSRNDEEMMTFIDNSETNVYTGLYELNNLINDEYKDVDMEDDNES